MPGDEGTSADTIEIADGSKDSSTLASKTAMTCMTKGTRKRLWHGWLAVALLSRSLCVSVAFTSKPTDPAEIASVLFLGELLS